MGKKILSSDGELVFVAIQPGKGQIAIPTSSDTVYLTAAPSATQKPKMLENKEMRRTRDTQPGKAGKKQIGDLKLQTNLVVSGTPGVTSCIHPLLLSAYGRHIVNTGVNVTYETYRYDDNYVYLTILYRKEASVEWLVDCAVNEKTMKVTADQLQVIDWNLFFLGKFRAGTGHLDAAIDGTSTPVTAIVLKTKKEARGYDAGARINIGSDSNSGAGYKITAVNVDTKTLTIEGGVATVQVENAEVTPWSPVDVAAGYTVNGGFGDFLIDESDGPQSVQITSADFALKNNIAKIEDQRQNTKTYVGEFGSGKREVTLNAENYFTIDDNDAEYHLQNQTQIGVELNMGEDFGYRAKLVIPNLRLTDVNESGDAQKKMGKQGKCYPDAGDDSVMFVLY